jgi:hypothetical protein
MLQIIKDKPLPPDGRGGGMTKYGVANLMEVGDCVIVENYNQAKGLRYHFKGSGKKCTTRKLPEGGIGVWRTE